MGNDAKLALVRNEIEKNASPETLEAFDVWRLCQRAADGGLPVEWFEWFIADVKRGVPPVEAARHACREWDL